MAMARSPIRRLPIELVNRIAAGEVVERPSSVVKELCENALDAGARRVDVEVEGGGVGRIRVIDDGHGMAPSEMRLALERHATSKIESAEDLWSLRTLGFRGEALPSIAAVSRLTLISRPSDAEVGFRLLIEGGAVIEEGPYGAPIGTQLEVRDLFFNTPARRKFQRTDATEAGHIEETIRSLALTDPSRHFRLQLGNRTALDLPPHADFAQRVTAALGRRGQGLFAVEGEDAGVRIRALLSPPEASIPTSRSLYFLVNGRVIRDRGLGWHTTLGYGELIPRGRYPVGAIAIDLPLDRVDVNVHPQKAEVRFASPELVQSVLRHTVATGVARAPWLELIPSRSEGSPSHEAPSTRYESQSWPLFATPRAAEATLPSVDPRRPLLPSLSYVGQALGTYLVCETTGALVLIDQHAAHERIVFERLKRAFRAGKVASQPLLEPIVVELDGLSAAAVGTHAELLAMLGFDLTPLDGARHFALRATPALLAHADPERLARELLDELAGGGAGQASTEQVEHILATTACHSVTRAGDRLSEEEATALIQALDDIDHHGSCPHGRPVLLHMPAGEIERRFGRT